MSKLNWGRLVSQGRAKAHGVSWSNKEGLAIVKICEELNKRRDQVAPYVRKGILTVKAFIKAQEKDGLINPYLKLPIDKLLKKAKDLGLEATPDTTVEILAEIILQEEERQKVEKEEEKKEIEAKEKEAKKAKEIADKEVKDKEDKAKKEKEDAKKKEEDKATELDKEETKNEEGKDDKKEEELKEVKDEEKVKKD